MAGPPQKARGGKTPAQKSRDQSSAQVSSAGVLSPVAESDPSTVLPGPTSQSGTLSTNTSSTPYRPASNTNYTYQYQYATTPTSISGGIPYTRGGIAQASSSQSPYALGASPSRATPQTANPKEIFSRTIDSSGSLSQASRSIGLAPTNQQRNLGISPGQSERVAGKRPVLYGRGAGQGGATAATSPTVAEDAAGISRGRVGEGSGHSTGHSAGKGAERSGEGLGTERRAQQGRGQGNKNSGSGTARAPSAQKPLPRKTSFLFHIDNVNTEGGAPDRQGHWEPPTVWDQINPLPASNRVCEGIYRWEDGEVHPVPFRSLPDGTVLHSHRNCPDRYRCTTVFTQLPDTGHFLSVPFDSRRANVCEGEPGKWLEMGFSHVPHPSIPNSLFSSLQSPGDNHTLVQRSPWAQELFTDQFLPQAIADDSVSHAGLIGDLSLIIAAAAFSCNSRQFPEILDSFQPHRWVPHGRTPGRVPRRGKVVTIWIDPLGSTTKQILANLENGDYGSIFGP